MAVVKSCGRFFKCTLSVLFAGLWQNKLSTSLLLKLFFISFRSLTNLPANSLGPRTLTNLKFKISFISYHFFTKTDVNFRVSVIILSLNEYVREKIGIGKHQYAVDGRIRHIHCCW